MESWKEAVFKMINLDVTITDFEALSKRVRYIDGFAFTALPFGKNHPNIFDAIIVRNPVDAQTFSPKYEKTNRTLEENVNFINQHKLQKAVIISDDIGFLKYCPTLQYLYIIPSDSCDYFDYTPLYEMPDICGLNCTTEYGKHFLKHTSIDYQFFSGLVELQIAGKGHLNINKVPILRRLDVSRNSCGVLSEFVSSDSLEYISLVQCGIYSLSGITCTKSLSELCLSYNRNLSDVSEIIECSETLKTLSIEACSKIKDFSFLSKLNNLEHLELRGNNTIQNLSFLLEMKKLKHFIFDVNIEDGDLTPCLSVPYVFSCRNRKHYNLMDVDLPKG